MLTAAMIHAKLPPSAGSTSPYPYGSEQQSTIMILRTYSIDLHVSSVEGKTDDLC